MLIPPQDFVFIADEAGISEDRYTVVGGLCMHTKTLERTYETLKEYRQKFNMKSELKWQKISDKKESEYKALIKYFFAMNNAGFIQFHSIIFDSHQWNRQSYKGIKGDVGLSILYYELLLHRFVRVCGAEGTLSIRLDHRNSQISLEEIRQTLNATASKRHGIHTNPVKQLVSVDSKKCDLLQLNDVILGAVCAARNGRPLLAGGRGSKRRLAEYVLEESGLGTFESDSSREIHRFTVWNKTPGAEIG